ncbi:MAG: leishmanolysin-related zinc metalloendopeptidase [Providencia heimbachae]|nr:leishmanolysin-related zinc metalloendopeptidase [Providencia heimbachae]
MHDRIAAMQSNGSRGGLWPAVAEVRPVDAPAHRGSWPRRLYDVFFSAQAGAQWQPIRIGTSVEDLYNSSQYCVREGDRRPSMDGGSFICTSAMVLTPWKRDQLVKHILPQAIAMHAERLSVRRTGTPLVVPQIMGGTCSYFTTLQEHSTHGVPNTDFMLYVSAAPTEDGDRAWTISCDVWPDGRPKIGATNISPDIIEDTRHPVRTVLHEMLHALGFSVHVFTDRGMVGYGTYLNGAPVNMINSPAVLRYARLHYGCPTLTGVMFENHGGRDVNNSHWHSSVAKEELMAAAFTGIEAYTALTIAAMEDTGFYKGDYSKAEPMKWGRNIGCGNMSSAGSRPQ